MLVDSNHVRRLAVSFLTWSIAQWQPSLDDWWNDLQVGWQCPRCTYVNEPTRPGCLSCTASRPDDYKIPDGYVPTEAERMRMDCEKSIEEVSPLYFMACDNGMFGHWLRRWRSCHWPDGAFHACVNAIVDNLMMVCQRKSVVYRVLLQLISRAQL